MDSAGRSAHTQIDSGQKVGVVGVGAVGSACAFALILRGSCGEIVLIDKDERRAAGVATDMRYAVSLSRTVVVREGGYGDLAGADVVLITAGVNEKSGGATDRSDAEGRLRLLDTNAEIYRDIVPRIVEGAPGAVLVAVTDPPDPLADLARRLAGHDRVLSTGTYLDSLRLRQHIALELGVDPETVDAHVVGEHGTSQVMLWSSATVGATPVSRVFADMHGEDAVARLREQVEQEVRYANITIIEGNEASQYGIGVAAARITEALLADERAVLPVAAHQQRYGVTVSLPGVIGRHGVLQSFEPEMSDAERAAFSGSVETLRRAAARIGVSSTA